MFDRAVREGVVPGVIVVAADFGTPLGGSFYASSPVTGDWEGFPAEELVAYVDAHFRTLAARDARGLLGDRMGGYGALRMGMRRPDVFGAVYAMHPVGTGAGIVPMHARPDPAPRKPPHSRSSSVHSTIWSSTSSIGGRCITYGGYRRRTTRSAENGGDGRMRSCGRAGSAPRRHGDAAGRGASWRAAVRSGTGPQGIAPSGNAPLERSPMSCVGPRTVTLSPHARPGARQSHAAARERDAVQQRLTRSPSGRSSRSATSRAASSERRNAPPNPSSRSARSRSPANVLGQWLTITSTRSAVAGAFHAWRVPAVRRIPRMTWRTSSADVGGSRCAATWAWRIAATRRAGVDGFTPCRAWSARNTARVPGDAGQESSPRSRHHVLNVRTSSAYARTVAGAWARSA